MPWEQISSTLSALVSHVSFYWASHQRELAEAHERMKLLKERVRDKEASLSKAASIAAGLKMASGSGSSPGRPGSALRTGRDRPRCFSANAAQRAREAGFVSAGVGAGVSAGGVDIDDLDSP